MNTTSAIPESTEPSQSRSTSRAQPTATAGKIILIVEDESDLAEMVQFNLEREGYLCHAAHSGDQALATIQQHRPDLVLLDRMLPGLSGDDVAMRIKGDPSTSSIPILMLTAKAEETDQLTGFALGSDDYVTKPFSIKVLLARIAAIFRRLESKPEEVEVIHAGPVRLIPSHHEAFVNGDPVLLTPTEFRLLKVLMTGRGRVMDRERLINRVLGEHVVVTDRTIDVHITALRKKLGPASRWVQTIRGVGYSFRELR